MMERETTIYRTYQMSLEDISADGKHIPINGIDISIGNSVGKILLGVCIDEYQTSFWLAIGKMIIASASTIANPSPEVIGPYILMPDCTLLKRAGQNPDEFKIVEPLSLLDPRVPYKRYELDENLLPTGVFGQAAKYHGTLDPLDSKKAPLEALVKFSLDDILGSGRNWQTPLSYNN